jgi:hypothetical protein
MEYNLIKNVQYPGYRKSGSPILNNNSSIFLNIEKFIEIYRFEAAIDWKNVGSGNVD